MHALWQSQIPSRFVDELPEVNVEVAEQKQGLGGFGGIGGYAKSRFDEPAAGFQSNYATPGWKRAQAEWNKPPTAAANDWKSKPDAGVFRAEQRRRAGPVTLEGKGELIATSAPDAARFKIGERVFHQKFGYGYVLEVDGNKLEVEFDISGSKKVVDTFVERH